jgi:hypothetical protein
MCRPYENAQSGLRNPDHHADLRCGLYTVVKSVEAPFASGDGERKGCVVFAQRGYGGLLQRIVVMERHMPHVGLVHESRSFSEQEEHDEPHQQSAVHLPWRWEPERGQKGR